MTFATIALKCEADGVADASVTFDDADIAAVRVDSLDGITNRPDL